MTSQQFKILKIIISLLSATVLAGSGFLLMQMPLELQSSHLFKLLVVIMVINLGLFIYLKTKLHSQTSVKDPKPHSKK